MKLTLILVAFLFINSIINAQNPSSYKNIRYNATEYYRLEEYQKALPLLLKVDSLKPNQGSIIYKIGVSHYNIGHRVLAFPYLKKAAALGTKDMYVDYYLGRCYHLFHKFDSAKLYLEQYKKLISKKKKPKYDITLVNRYITMCEVGKELISKPVEVTITNLGNKINSKYPDYAPVISADETVLIFTSRRTNTIGGQTDPGDDQHFEDLYICTREHPDSAWSDAVNMGSNINTESHDASIGLSPDGQELFVYRSSNDNKSGISGDIWVSDLRGSEWTPPSKMHKNINSTYWEPSCSVTPDEKTMYFSSNKPGGVGGRDIYVSKKIAGDDWTEPQNLGNSINTEQDEDAPFIHPDGKTLFFSSRAHHNMGGFDIFTSTFDEKSNTWSSPQNLGYPINTADDDIFFVWSPDGTKAYFSSIREDSYGDKDVYLLKRPDIHNFIIVLKGKILSKESKKPIAATISITDLGTNQLAGIFNSNSFNGKFTSIMNPGKNYAITIEAPGHLFYSENINIPDEKTFKEITKEILLEPINEGSKTALNNVFFETNSSTLKPDSYLELDRIAKVLNDNKNLFVEIAGHTDSTGSKEVNKKLSQQRADALVKYLNNKGIDKARFQAIGYGDQFPVASNATEEGRGQNRRTEMIVVESLPENKKFDQIISTLDSGWYYKQKNQIEKLIAAEKVQKNLNEKIIEGKKQDVDLKTPVVLLDISKIKVSNLYYPPAKYELNDTAKIILDSLSQLLKLHPLVKIKLISHTDDINTIKFNYQLAVKRLDIIIKYLASKGIDKSKLKAIPVGELLPISDNSTPEGRKLNRRVEIKIISKK